MLPKVHHHNHFVCETWLILGFNHLGITLVYVLDIKVIHKVILTLNLTFILTGPLILSF